MKDLTVAHARLLLKTQATTKMSAKRLATDMTDLSFLSYSRVPAKWSRPTLLGAKNLASPRLPKQWSTLHETAWEWLWMTVSRNLRESTMKAQKVRARLSQLSCHVYLYVGSLELCRKEPPTTVWSELELE